MSPNLFKRTRVTVIRPVYDHDGLRFVAQTSGHGAGFVFGIWPGTDRKSPEAIAFQWLLRQARGRSIDIRRYPFAWRSIPKFPRPRVNARGAYIVDDWRLYYDTTR